jgi:hypothetical protein
MWCLEGGTTFGSYPRASCGPMADETVAWLNRVSFGLPTPAATAREAHRNLMLTKVLDLSPGAGHRSRFRSHRRRLAGKQGGSGFAK